MKTSAVVEAFTEEEIDHMLNPYTYIGLAPEFVDRVVARWEGR
jgi:adenylosuccinate lyase